MLRTRFARALALLLSFALPNASVAEADASDSLLKHFVVAFNSGEYETMARFYADHATEDFNGRRTEAESRELHGRLVELLGNLTLRSIAGKDGGVQLLADATAADGTAEFRFRLAGDPPRIDGFSVGVQPPHAGAHDSVADDAPGSAEDHAAEAAASGGPFAFLAEAEGVHQSQIFAQADGSLLLVWVQRGLYSLDLFAARLGEDGVFSHPVRINRKALNRFVGDEARPGVAIGEHGAVAVVWTAADNDILLAVGSGYGTAFEAPVKLNQDTGRAERTMPTVAFGPDGAPHAIWLDPREAPAGMEEPSDLYLATLRDGAVQETNLTARQQTSVCGCCRPFIAIDEAGRCDIAFRNVSDTGYRDIWRIGGSIGALGDPEPTSPPIWKLGGCPSAGPIVTGDGTLWKDASTGNWRVLWATDPATEPEALFDEGEPIEFSAPPRVVSGRPSWVLVGARPAALLATHDDEGWRVLRRDLPPWVTSAAVHDGRLVLVGNVRGRQQTAVLPLHGSADEF